jgi:hypothetical protein
LYKTLLILYVVIFSLYVLFTRVPDYFDGELIKGVVAEAAFSKETNSPLLVIEYNVGSETRQYKTHMWFLKKYKPGQLVTIIYNPEHPSIASIYAFIGYWIRWPELIFTSIFFVILFIASKAIAGNSSGGLVSGEEFKNERK